MADFRVIEPLATKILDTTNAWSGVAGKLTGAVMAPLLVGVTLLVMWHGFNIIRGAGGQHAILDVFAKFLRAFLVIGLALGAGAYASNVVGFFQELRNGLTSMFVSGSSTSYSALDSSISAALSSWDPTWAWASDHITIMSMSPDTSGIVALGCWFFMVGALMIFAAICAINLIVVDFALALIFALGPMFVACFAFQATARFTDAWLGGVLKYTFTAVVIAAVSGLGIGILQTYTGALAASAGALDFVTAAFAAVGASLILCILTARIPAIAGDIVGGIGISAVGPAMAARPLSSVASMGRKGMNGTAQGAANATGFYAGKFGNTRPAAAAGAAAGRVGAALSQSPLGAKFATAQKHAGDFSRAVGSKSVGDAYAIGQGRAPGAEGGIGVGSVTGGRPVARQHAPVGARI